jgi:hypothetical protein
VLGRSPCGFFYRYTAKKNAPTGWTDRGMFKRRERLGGGSNKQIQQVKPVVWALPGFAPPKSKPVRGRYSLTRRVTGT